MGSAWRHVATPKERAISIRANGAFRESDGGQQRPFVNFRLAWLACHRPPAAASRPATTAHVQRSHGWRGNAATATATTLSCIRPGAHGQRTTNSGDWVGDQGHCPNDGIAQRKAQLVADGLGNGIDHALDRARDQRHRGTCGIGDKAERASKGLGD